MKINFSLKNRKKPNWKVVIFALAALGFVALTFLVNPYFIIGAVVLMIINQRELKRKKDNSEKVNKKL